MKFNIIIAALILCQGFAKINAQTTEKGKPSFGIYGGVNFQNINGTSYNGDKLSNSLVTKFHGGINEQIPVAPDFYVQLGVQYTGKGAKGDVPYLAGAVQREVRLNYIEVPVNFLYKPLVGEGHFLLGFGPYVGYAFSGKAIFTGDLFTAEQKINFDKEISVSNPNDLTNYKHLDVGANAFFGYEFMSKLNMVFNAQLGLVSINSKNKFIPNNKRTEMNTGFGLSLGYRL